MQDDNMTRVVSSEGMLYLCLIFHFILPGLVEFFLDKPQSRAKYWRQALVSIWNRAPREKCNFLFLKGFLLVLKKVSFSEEDWALGYNSMTFWDFPDIS